MKTTLVKNPSVFIWKSLRFAEHSPLLQVKKCLKYTLVDMVTMRIIGDVSLVVTISTNVYFRPHFSDHINAAWTIFGPCCIKSLNDCIEAAEHIVPTRVVQSHLEPEPVSIGFNTVYREEVCGVDLR